jgi:DNA-binding protein Fis
MKRMDGGRRATPGVTIAIDEVLWRIVKQDAADLGAERGTTVTPMLWIEEAIIERDLSQRFQVRGPEIVPRHRKSLADVQRDYLIELIENTGYNISQAARIAGIERHTLARLLRKYGIQRGERRRKKARSSAIAVDALGADALTVDALAVDAIGAKFEG